MKEHLLSNNLIIPIKSDGDAEKDLSLFVSPGEYPIYDESNYDFMQEDKHTERAYINAIKNNVEDKDVLDIGTGRDMDWAMYSLDYKAKSATGVEMVPSTVELAKKSLIGHIYEKHIKVIEALSTEWETKEKFDVIVSEIIGTIGGSEGTAVALKDAQDRLLKPNGKMIPYSCITKAGAVCIRDMINPLQFHPHAIKYIEKIFDYVGQPFDLRLTLSHNKPTHVISTHGNVETLIFTKEGLIVEGEEVTSLTIKKSGRIDGLLLWINLLAEENGKVIDSLYQQTSWETVYIPIFDEPIEVKKGDKLNIFCERTLSDNNINPDYRFNCILHTKEGAINGNFTSLHHPKSKEDFQTKQIYKELFKQK